MRVINLGRAAPVSLEPLSNLNNLSELHINNVFWPIRDLSPLGQLYRLRFISFDRDEALTDGDFEALSRLRNLDEIRFGFNNELSSIEFLRNHPRLKNVLIGYAKISDFSRIADLEFLQVLNIYEQGTQLPLDVSFLRANRELLSFGTHMGIAGERVFLYLNKLKVFSTGWSGSPDQPHQFSEYTNLDFLMNAVELEQISVENYGLSDFSRLSSFPNLKSLNINGNRISDLSVLTGLDQLESVSLVSNELQTLGDVLINWPALLNGNTSFNLSTNPLPCSEIEAARANPNITVEFDGECSIAGIDAFKFDAPGRPFAGYYYAVTDEPKTFPFELSDPGYRVAGAGGFTSSRFTVIVEGQERYFEYPWNDFSPIQQAFIDSGTELTVFGQIGYHWQLEHDEKRAADLIFASGNPSDWLYDASDVVIDSGYVVMTPPLPGTGYAGENCAITSPNDQTGLKRLSQQITHNGQLKAFFSDRIEGGSSRVFERRDIGADTIVLCSDTPPGRYELTGAILDGRGGKKLFNLTVEVLTAQTPGGKLEWFIKKPSPLFYEPFDIDTATFSETFLTYDRLESVRPDLVRVLDDRLEIIPTGIRDANLAYAVTIKRQFSGDLELEAPIGGEGEAVGSFMVGVSVGNNVLLFHPGLDGGQFRHEVYDDPTFPGVISRPPNMDMGFTPAQQVLHLWQVIVDGETGLVRVIISQGDHPTNQYQYEFTDTRLLQPYTLGLIGDGNVGAGYGYIDSLTVHGNYAGGAEDDRDGDGVPDNVDAFPMTQPPQSIPMATTCQIDGIRATSPKTPPQRPH